MQIKILFIFLLCGLLSCQQPSKKPDNKDSIIIGNWTLCKIIYFESGGRSSGINFNVCPEIKFSKNNSGFIKRSDPMLLYFNWRVSGDELTIRHIRNKDKDDIIDDGTYKIIHPNKTFHEVDLLDTVKHIKYILGA
jgi:hypothetical protein